MLTGIIIIATIGLLTALSHRRSRLENKIYKNVPLSEWLIVLVFPIILYLGWFSVVKNIVDRPKIAVIPFDDFDILTITILFMVYGFVGNSIHFTGKILWRYLASHKNLMAYKVNEMFHGRLSHYLVYLNGLFIIFLLYILEINHPVMSGVTSKYLFYAATAGVIFGISASKSVFYSNEWFGGYNKPLFIIVSILLSVMIMVSKILRLNYSLYPVNLFVTSMGVSFIAAFVMRQLFIFARLGGKRRLRFLAKILSV